jgi:hypothetical protein
MSRANANLGLHVFREYRGPDLEIILGPFFANFFGCCRPVLLKVPR